MHSESNYQDKFTRDLFSVISKELVEVEDFDGGIIHGEQLSLKMEEMRIRKQKDMEFLDGLRELQ